MGVKVVGGVFIALLCIFHINHARRSARTTEKSTESPHVPVGPKLTENQIIDIVKIHNEARSSVSPCSTDMNKIVWDNQLAMISQSAADLCNPMYNTTRAVLGANLEYYSPAQAEADPVMLVQRWAEQHCQYKYCSDSCKIGYACDHYRTMVTAIHEKVGCGYQLCPNYVNGQSANLLICNYSPLPYNSFEKPYDEGKPCTLCTKNMCRCEDNMCTSPNVMSDWTTAKM